MQESPKIRILVADDHPILREGLVAVLNTQPDFEIVGEAADGSEAVRLAERLEPDVILLDLEMPELDGVAALKRLRDRRAHFRGATRWGSGLPAQRGIPNGDLRRRPCRPLRRVASGTRRDDPTTGAYRAGR